MRCAARNLTALTLVALGSRAWAEPARYELDPEHLTIAFLV